METIVVIERLGSFSLCLISFELHAHYIQWFGDNTKYEMNKVEKF